MINTEKKQFQYEIQNYQDNCVKNIVSIFEHLEQKENFADVVKAHQEANKYNFPIKADSKNIDIMMETGTGKTFTYIKTIFELCKNFKYKKFIVLIPSVPIREGTRQNFDDTKEYFKSFYANEQEKEIETFVYESGNISAVKQFINTTNLSVLVMTPSSFNSSDNVLNRPLENEINTPELFTTIQEPPKSYLDCLKRLNPIIIMDEPHRFEGNAFKTYFDGFNNYYLRFGATFPTKKDTLELSNVAYVMDSISSFRQNLVKKIVVWTQDIIENIDTLVDIEGKKAIVQTLSNGVVVKREVKAGETFNGKNVKKINKSELVLDGGTIEKVDYSLTDESLRKMISQTIKIHFEKEQELFYQNIKALTLFFIESDIKLFRGENAKIKKIFEEEYITQRKEILQKLDKTSDYYKYLQNDFDTDGTLLVHKGYFSGDKGNADEKIQAGVDEILKDKKKLLSFESPTRFIFSIWALQEGWDNPNVFTICKLSNQGNEISKLQQIGRGLRICVNQNLQRNTYKFLYSDQEKFWKINNLDVVVSSKEQGFVESIQSEILSNSFLIAETFTEQELKIIIKEKGKFNDIEVRNLYKTMENSGMIEFSSIVNGIDVFKKSSDFSTILKQQNLPPEQVKVIESIFATDTNTYVQKGESKKAKKKVFIKSSKLEEFKDLWNAINKNADYYLETLNKKQEEQLINNIKKEIEALDITAILLETRRRELQVDKLDQTDAIKTNLIDKVTYKSKVDYLSFVKSLSNATKTPITFIVRVFNALSKDFKEKMLCNNPEQAQKEMVAIIQKNLVAMIKTNVTYKGLTGVGLPNVFKMENGKTYLATGSVGKFQKDIESDFDLKEKWVFEEVIEYDSDFELEVIEQDPDMDSIEIFGKLPKLKIKTPLGEYNPDFCYAIKSKKGNKLFLIVETKGYKTSTEVPENEKGKIDFAKKYFESLNSLYKNDNIKITYKERINRQQLSAIISEVTE